MTMAIGGDTEVTTEGAKEPWQIKLAQRLGLPTAFLLVLLYMLYMAATWSADNIVMPLFQKQTEFIDKATGMMEDMSDTLRDGQITALKTQTDVDVLAEALKTQTEVLKSIDTTLKQRSPQ